MSEPSLEPVADPAEAVRAAVKHLIWGAIPALIAIIVVILQAATSFVGPGHRGLFEIGVLSCMMFTLTVWIWCTVTQVRRQFKASDEAAIAAIMNRFDDLHAAQEERFDEIDAGLRHLEHIMLKTRSSIEGLHKRVDQLENDHQALKEGGAHLRRLIIEGGESQPVNGQRLGPRSLN